MEDLITQEQYIGRFSLHGTEAVEILAVQWESEACNRITKYAYILSGEIRTCYYSYMTKLVDVTMSQELVKHKVSDYIPTKYGSASEVAEAALKTDFFQIGEVGEFVMRHLDRKDYPRTSSRSRLHQPERDGEKISLYLTAKDYKRSRRTSMKPGRAFKHMFNTLDTAAISNMTENWLEQSKPREFTLKLGDTRADFRRAYCGVRAKSRNPLTTAYRKNIANSCMHTLRIHDDDDGEGDMSPAEVFATGDFNVAWLETDQGHIAGRVVFSNKNLDNRTHAPIYGACEQSLNELAKFLTDAGIKHGEEWEGLRLLHMTSGGNTVAPYMDCNIGGDVSGNNIWLAKLGELDLESTTGTLDERNMCEHCEDRMSSDETIETNAGYICRSCFDDLYITTDDGQVHDINECMEVLYLSGTRQEYMWVHQDEAVYCELRDEYWEQYYVTWSDDMEQAIPTHLIEDYPELFNEEEPE